MKHIISGLTKLTVASILIFSVTACGGADERKVKYLEKGKTYLADKNYDKARIELKNVLQIDPKFAEAHFLMGRLEESGNEIAKAVGNYRKAIELDPSYVLAKVKLSKIYVIAGTDETIKEAKQLLGEIEKSGADTPESELIRATIEYKTGSKEKATLALESIIEKDIKLVEGVLLLANIYAKNEEYDKARVLLIKGSKNNPENIKLRITLAQLYANKIRDMDAGEKLLLETVKIDPDNYSLQLGLAAFYSRIHKLEKAEEVLRNAVKQNDEDVNRYLKLIDFLSTRVSLKQAEDELINAINNKPDLYMLKFAQAQFYMAYGKKDEAESVLKKIIDDKSFDVEGVRARTILAKYLLDQGNNKGAKKYVEEVIAEYPNNSDALLITSKLALMNLDATSAINGLRTVVKNEPKNTEASLLLAQAHELNKESSLAESELKKAIEANPVNDQAHANYARYLASKGRIDEAVDVIDKALTYFKNSYDLMDIKLKIVASQGKDAEVLTLLNMMEDANATKAEVNLIKGKYYLAKREITQAVEQFEKAYKKSRDKFKPLQMIIKTYMVGKQSEKALKRLQENLDKNPDDAIANLLLGQVYLAQKKTPEAREKFIQASKAAETWVVPYTSLAATYLAENNADKALAIYQDALTKLKNKAPAQMQVAAIYEKKKDYPAAMKVYQDVLSENSTDKLAVNNYVSLLLDHGSKSDAPTALELAKGFEKIQQPALQDTLAWAYAKTGDSAKAVEILMPIVEKAPKIAVFRYHLGYALYQLGDKAAAKSHLEIAASSEQKYPGKDNAGELLKSI